MSSPTPLLPGSPELPADPPAQLPATCDNCGATLTGKYCAACGQRHEPHVQSLAHFVAEGIEGVTHADSRLWRSLGYLLARPGLLTREFLEGRRARYLPPFRLYLVISVVFFLVGMPERVSVKQQSAGEVLDSATLLKQAEQVDSADNLLPEAMRKQTVEYLRAEAAEAKAREAAGIPPALPEAGSEPEKHDVSVSFGGLDLYCKSLKEQAASEGLIRKSLRERCERLAASDGSSMGEVVIHNVPRAMFLFLPLLAIVMKALYWRQKRYYVEHLLFLIHNHAFVFLAATLVILAGRVPFTAAVMGWVWAAASLYVVWYLFRAMRNVYGQGRAITLAKYLTLGTTYLATSVVMLILTVIYSAMTL